MAAQFGVVKTLFEHLFHAQLAAFAFDNIAKNMCTKAALRVVAIGLTRDFERHFAQRLASTPEREAGEDWLWPHANDGGQWLANYGASVSIEGSRHVELRGISARRAQNGILLSHVSHATVEACDASYLSGWGLGMWRASDNRVLGNRFDYNIRGYSHGVYNRGQDSAGILAFEQCSRNVFLGNSATHCGDGFFGFSGKEALGEVGDKEPDWYRRRGNNNNVFEGNDFSYAAAHGLELTFGFDNIVRRNVFRGNAICGVWGGFSQGTLIEDNLFAFNGDAGYGAERGGINIDHAGATTIRGNRFGRNAVGVRLWRKENPFAERPWGQANDLSCRGNLLEANSFVGDVIAMELAGDLEVTARGNSYVAVDERVIADGDVTFTEEGADGHLLEADPRPGRESIRMTEWGPWDGASPFAQLEAETDRGDVWLLSGFEEQPGVDRPMGAPWRARWYPRRETDAPDQWRVRIEIKNPDDGGANLLPYDIQLLPAEGVEATEPLPRLTGLVQNIRWTVARFANPCDPREDLATWRREAASSAPAFHVGALLLPYGTSGPPTWASAGEPQVDDFGTFAEGVVRIPAGRWRITTLSDDGVRIVARRLEVGKTEPETWIENWTHHGPTVDEHMMFLQDETAFALVVEHFELDGHAWLELDFEWLGAE